MAGGKANSDYKRKSRGKGGGKKVQSGGVINPWGKKKTPTGGRKSDEEKKHFFLPDRFQNGAFLHRGVGGRLKQVKKRGRRSRGEEKRAGNWASGGASLFWWGG